MTRRCAGAGGLNVDAVCAIAVVLKTREPTARQGTEGIADEQLVGVGDNEDGAEVGKRGHASEAGFDRVSASGPGVSTVGRVEAEVRFPLRSPLVFSPILGIEDNDHSPWR